ncbi:SDR family NAD(P)-dependent oxidoreductase [Hyalangium versicolor]|uniref:SDR family NAD(P)-dependent oxidoreductase n=1 Tax=Hyalangium versicolor TaxID=2861190 RepID=UPI001CCC289C|nr:SDR family oxidoreductase [Hyalangium versicolor]
MSSEQKVAIVTGASQGIGAGLVKGFRSRGYRVVANSRSIQPSVTGGDPNILTVEGDVGDPRTADRIINAAVERFGRVDTLVNNAGIFIPKPFVEYTEADFTAMLSVNLAGFFYVSRRAALEMLRRGTGHIVNITTSLVVQPMAGVPAALASLTKGGLDAVTRSLAIEYAEKGVRVNAVSPGIIKTPMHPEKTHAALAGLQPMRRLGEVEEIVDAVLYLDTAAFVTGEILHVDGGAHAGRW